MEKFERNICALAAAYFAILTSQSDSASVAFDMHGLRDFALTMGLVGFASMAFLCEQFVRLHLLVRGAIVICCAMGLGGLVLFFMLKSAMMGYGLIIAYILITSSLFCSLMDRRRVSGHLKPATLGHFKTNHFKGLISRLQTAKAAVLGSLQRGKRTL